MVGWMVFSMPSYSSSLLSFDFQVCGAPPKRGTLKVVCPSYGRTGTTSMLAALEILGFGPCYHCELRISSHASGEDVCFFVRKM